MNTLLVTGGCGFIGNNFVRYWLERHPGSRVVVLDKLTYAGRRENLQNLWDDPRVLGQLRYILRHGRADLVPLLLLESVAKLSAFQLGRHYRWLPLALRKGLSMHSYHWERSREQQRKEQT